MFSAGWLQHIVQKYRKVPPPTIWKNQNCLLYTYFVPHFQKLDESIAADSFFLSQIPVVAQPVV